MSTTDRVIHVTVDDPWEKMDTTRLPTLRCSHCGQFLAKAPGHRFARLSVLCDNCGSTYCFRCVAGFPVYPPPYDDEEHPAICPRCAPLDAASL